VRSVCRILDELRPARDRKPHESLIRSLPTGLVTIVAMQSTLRKAARNSAGKPVETFESGIGKNRALVSRQSRMGASVHSGAYRNWVGRTNSRGSDELGIDDVIFGRTKFGSLEEHALSGYEVLPFPRRDLAAAQMRRAAVSVPI
jgi:hypothetical protein